MKYLPALIVSPLCVAFLFAVNGHAATLHTRTVQLGVSPEVRIARIAPHFGPKTRAFVAQEAMRDVASGIVDGAEVRSAVLSADLGASTSSDIDAVIEAVMFQIAADTEADLRNELTLMQQEQSAKKQARSQVTKMYNQEDAIKSHESQEYVRPQSAGQLTPRYTLDQYRAINAQQLQDQLDSMNDLSELEQMRLQELMDRRAKALETISNLVKKESDTQEAIIDNLK
jgi:uncharacterized protein YdiU (UPF0061 family)